MTEKTCKLKGYGGISVRVRKSTVIGDLFWTARENEKCDMSIFVPYGEYFKYDPWTEYGYIVTIHGHGYCPDSIRLYFDADEFHRLFEDIEWEMVFDELTEEIFKERPV